MTKLLGDYKSHTLMVHYTPWDTYPSSLSVDITYEFGTESWQTINVSADFPKRFKIEEFLNCNRELILNSKSEKISYLGNELRIASITKHDNESKKVFIIFEREYVDGGLGAIIRYKVCTAKEITDEFAVSWTNAPFEHFKCEGKSGYLINDWGLKTFIYVEEKEVLNEWAGRTM